MQCLNHVGGKEFLEGETLEAADINEDGTVNLVDLMRLLNYVGGEKQHFVETNRESIKSEEGIG